MSQNKSRAGMWIWLIVVAVVAGLAWVRLAPSEPADWHVDPLVTANQDLIDGVRRRVPAQQNSFAILHQIILETPRTEVLSGDLATGMITYVTRSKWMGFPDYTTVKLESDQIEIWGRLRFGMADTGVNKARVDAWLARLATETQS